MLDLFKYAREGLAIVFVAGMNAVSENYTVDVASGLYAVSKYVFVLSLAEPAAFRVAGALLDVLLFLLPGFFLLGGIRVRFSFAAILRRLWFHVIVLRFFRFVLQRLLPMSLPIPVDLFPQLLLIPEGLFLNDCIFVLLAVGSGLHMGRIHEYYRFIYQPRFHAFFQYLLKDLLKQIAAFEPAHVILSEGAEMWHRVMQPKAEKPTVCCVYLDLLDRLPHAPDPKHVLHNRQLDQNDRIKAGTSVILAIAVRHHLVDEAPVNGVLQLSHKVIFRHQLVQTRELDLIPVLASISCHHVPRPLVPILP